MPSKIEISDFSGGMGLSERNLPKNQFYVGDGVDLYMNPGYIMPSIAISAGQDTAGSILRGKPYKCVVDAGAGKAYILTDNGDLHQITDLDNIANTAGWNSNFDGSSHYYYAIGSYTTPSNFLYPGDLLVYQGKLLFTYNTSAHGYLGTYDLSSSFAATAGDLGNTATVYSSLHPMLEWNSFAWIGNGQYVAKWDNSSITAQALNLGAGWTVTALFPTQNYIGICATKNTGSNKNLHAESRVFFWDGTSTTFNTSIPIQENFINTAINHNGTIYMTAQGRNNAASFGVLTKNGMSIIRKTRFSINGAVSNFGQYAFQNISVVNNKVFLSVADGGAAIVSYGSDQDSQHPSFSFPYSVSTNTSNFVLFSIKVKQRILIGWRSAVSGNGSLSQVDLTSTSYGTAIYKGGYIDFGQNVKLLYVDFFFQSLASGMAATVSVDYNYGTAGTLRDPAGNSTISFATDGAITRKRFKFGMDVHSARPVINWTTGGMAVSKIILTYGQTPDDF